VFPNPLPGFEKPRAFPGQTWGDVFLLGNAAVDDPSVLNIDATTYLYRPNVPEVYTAEQIISAGYATISVSLGTDVDLVFGARLEGTDLKVRASPIYIYPEQSTRLALLSPEQQIDPEITNLLDQAFFGDPLAQQDPRLVARSRSNIHETHLLPALALTWDFSDEARVRAAISRTIARPSFKEMAPVPFLSVESGDLFVGNVDLQMSEIMNYDARWEWFPEPASLVAVSLFSKAIQNPIELSVEGDVVRFINVDEGHVFGFELEYQRSLDFLAEELRHWSIGANYSYIQSSATRPVLPGGSPSIYGPSRRLQGQPDYIFNFNLTYDNPDFGLMAGLFLNSVGPQLFAVAADFQDPDIFQEPYSTLDFALSKDIGKNCKVTFRAANLLNSELTRFYNSKERPLYSSRDTGINYSLSLTFEW
jgi:TonB-dependent receptor